MGSIHEVTTMNTYHIIIIKFGSIKFCFEFRHSARNVSKLRRNILGNGSVLMGTECHNTCVANHHEYFKVVVNIPNVKCCIMLYEEGSRNFLKV